MPMTTTHALLPIAVAVAVSRRPVSRRLISAAALAAALPDVDGLAKRFLHLSPLSVYAHRGAAHSLFIAIAAGAVAAILHRHLRVRPLTAGVAITTSMASHGLLDMMTDSGQPVAYLWPVSSARLFADWRPIHSNPVHLSHFISDILARLQSEAWQLILPTFAVALVVRSFRLATRRTADKWDSEKASSGAHRDE
jgi:inner membrane protein